MSLVTYISNNCLAQEFYFKENRKYDHPFIGSLFVNDAEYVKFCSNFDHYIKVKPRFDFPRTDSVWAKQNRGSWYNHPEVPSLYPVMYLEDIEIHWIHEPADGAEALRKKYNRRVTRFNNQNKKNDILYLLCHSDLCNDHTPDEYKTLIKNFTSIPNSLYLTKFESDMLIAPNVFFIESWKDESEARDRTHIYTYHKTTNRIDTVYHILGLLNPSVSD